MISPLHFLLSCNVQHLDLTLNQAYTPINLINNSYA